MGEEQVSNHVSFLKTRKTMIPLNGDHWYVLLDRAGKVRDWLEADNGLQARYLFAKTRRLGLPKGYSVEKRGKVA